MGPFSVMSGPKISLLKQAINVSAILGSMKLVLRPSLGVPSMSIRSLDELDFERLKNNGIKYLVFDKDNTLSIAYADVLHESAQSTVAKATKQFPDAVAILSNSVGSSDDVDFKGAIDIEGKFGIPVIRHEYKKPSCADEVCRALVTFAM
jgi:phosphatidylglycerophosphatase GEP4